ncbi:MAG TPA: Na/Pi symporter [Blastocatellia bacterium]|nr:Na/Pi symporter [Blastocatellia bacterium]
MLESFGMLLVGLGLFVNGSNLLSSNLKSLTSRRFRLTLTKYIGKPWKAAIIGIVSSAVSQSSSVITFILAGLASSGMITVGNALPIWSWANVGSAILVALAVSDLKLAALYLLGIASLSVAFNKPVRYQRFMGAVYGVGLLFFGIQLMKTGATPLANLDAIKLVISNGSHFYLIAFLVGALLRLFIQSSSTASIIAITLAQANLLDAQQTMMIIFGTNVGSAATVMLLSGNIKGTTRQIVWFHMIFDFVGGALFAVLFYAEIYLHVPLVMALVNRFARTLAGQMAEVYLINRLVVALISASCSSIAYNFLSRVSPPTQEEELTKLHYMHEHAMDDPDLSLDLIEKEHARLFSRFPDYLESARNERRADLPDYRLLNKAFVSISTELSAFLADLMKNKDMDSITSGRLLNLIDRNNLIISIEKNVFQFVQTARKASEIRSLEMMLFVFIEGMDSLQHAAVEAMESMRVEEIDLLLTITFDRSNLMEQMRKESFNEGQSLNNQDRGNLFYLISLFERGVWLLNKLGRSLKKLAAEDTGTEPEWSVEPAVEHALTMPLD